MGGFASLLFYAVQFRKSSMLKLQFTGDRIPQTLSLVYCLLVPLNGWGVFYFGVFKLPFVPRPNPTNIKLQKIMVF